LECTEVVQPLPLVDDEIHHAEDHDHGERVGPDTDHGDDVNVSVVGSRARKPPEDRHNGGNDVDGQHGATEIANQDRSEVDDERNLHELPRRPGEGAITKASKELGATGQHFEIQ
jgi:hypothetical protein